MRQSKGKALTWQSWWESDLLNNTVLTSAKLTSAKLPSAMRRKRRFPRSLFTRRPLAESVLLLKSESFRYLQNFTPLLHTSWEDKLHSNSIDVWFDVLKWQIKSNSSYWMADDFCTCFREKSISCLPRLWVRSIHEEAVDACALRPLPFRVGAGLKSEFLPSLSGIGNCKEKFKLIVFFFKGCESFFIHTWRSCSCLHTEATSLQALHSELVQGSKLNLQWCPFSCA